MNNQFNSVLVSKPKKNAFDLSYSKKLTCEFGQLVPVFRQEYIPGDTFKVNSELLVKMSPSLAPIMSEIDARIDFFRCDFHLVNDKAVQMILSDENGEFTYPIQKLSWTKLFKLIDSDDFINLPSDEMGFLETTFNFTKTSTTTNAQIQEYICAGLFGHCSLWAHLGLPSMHFASGSSDAYPNTISLTDLSDNFHGDNDCIQPYYFLLNALIYNEYYRDQNLVEPIDVPRTYTDISNWLLKFNTVEPVIEEIESYHFGSTWLELIDIFILRNRCLPKDIFTSALPNPQRGGEVHLPMTGNASVGISSNIDISFPLTANNQILMSDTVEKNKLSYGTIFSMQDPDTKVISNTLLPAAKIQPQINKSEASKFSVDLSDVTSSTIEELRRAVQLQKYLELSARSGGRPGERIYANFYVKPSDSRLGRPEYLGGAKIPIRISEVLQTSETSVSTALGNAAGHGLGAGNIPGFKAFFNDYGVVLGILTIIPRQSYFQGVPREFSRFDPFEYYLPTFAQLGEQEIRNSEIYLSDDGYDDNNAVFGYTPRYAEYRQHDNEISGDFRGSLDFWHCSRIFANQPKLNSEFLEINSPEYNRIFPVVSSTTGSNHFYINLYHHNYAVREVVKFNIPTL